VLAVSSPSWFDRAQLGTMDYASMLPDLTPCDVSRFGISLNESNK
jgi:hypothetical protein